MDLQKQLVQVVERLAKEKLQFALAGGLASSIYRKNKRTTDDLDFLIYSESGSEEIARKILTDFNLKISEARKSQLEGNSRHSKATPIYILNGRREGEVGIDFILPNIPWFKKALERAQSNIITLGNLKLPCLTVEDVLITKFYSFNNNASRYADADDIKSIFESKAEPEIDLGYIASQMQKLNLRVPLLIEKEVPSLLLKTSKKLIKKARNSSRVKRID